MATVYLADDLKHHRKVAIKVLKSEVAATLGAERFLREIEIAAALSHPHILPLYDSGQAGGFLYYVMPFVPGESLRGRLNRERELPVADAVRILRDVVDALAYAHGQGVVHRDIKPDNVLLAGRHALVTDFGVAKAVSEATGRNALTTAGVALGTPAYMAPEQASGDPHLDYRVDIYATGVLAYELLSGRVPFDGPTAQSVLAAHVMEAPELLSKRRANVSPALAQLVMRCLEKKPADRWQSANELLPQLEMLATPSGGTTPTDTRPLPALPSRHRQRVTVIAAGIALLGIALLAFLFRPRPSESIRFGRAQRITNAPGLEVDPAISPDEKFIAYSAGSPFKMDVWVRPLNGDRAVNLTADLPGDHRLPQWSPDGAQILFITRQPGRHSGNVMAAPLGGTPRRLFQAAPGEELTSVAWAPDGAKIAYSVLKEGTGRIVALGLQDGRTEDLATDPEPYSLNWSRDGDKIAYASLNRFFVLGRGDFGNVAPGAIRVVSARGGNSTLVAAPDGGAFNSNPVWTPDGRLLFISSRDGELDVYSIVLARSGAPAGLPERLTTGRNAHGISIAHDGSFLAYSSWTLQSNIWMATVPGAVGPVSRASPVTAGSEAVEGIDLSPDRQWLVFDSYRNGNQDIYKMKLPSGEAIRLTNNSAADCCPSWSPDDKSVAFHSMRTGTRDIFIVSAEGGTEEQVTSGPAQDNWPRWSPDGKHLVFFAYLNGPRQLYITSRSETDGKWSEPARVTQELAANPDWSPDGKSLVYEIFGRRTLRVIPAEGGEPRTIGEDSKTVETVTRPHWSPDGSTVFYWAYDSSGGSSIWSTLAAGGPARLRMKLDASASQVYYSTFTTDGKRVFFSMGRHEADIWTSELTGLRLNDNVTR